MSEIQAITGMKDILPEQVPVWRHIEALAAAALAGYGYQEIRFPLLERTALFKRSIGEVTDIVEKEMYTFDDVDGDSISLRPEGTASCVRACIENRLIAPRSAVDTYRLWYAGPMFRREKPQKGRQRQFHQIGVEAFGMTGPDIDAEQILLTARLWRALGVEKAVTLELNSIGSAAARSAYKQALVAYLEQRSDQLDEDSRRRLHSNPLRILDSKEQATQRLLDGAPSLEEYLDDDSRSHFRELCDLLERAGVPFRLNPRLVRGLDYYNKTVFEWTTDRLGAQGTVCAGGRYDGLVQQLGGKPTPAVGFAMGLERLGLLLEACGTLPVGDNAAPQVYLVAAGEGVQAAALLLAEQLRGQLPALRLAMNCGGGSFKSQFKKADRSGAALALVLGEEEVARQVANVKWLRDDSREQQTVTLVELADLLRRELA